MSGLLKELKATRTTKTRRRINEKNEERKRKEGELAERAEEIANKIIADLPSRLSKATEHENGSLEVMKLERGLDFSGSIEHIEYSNSMYGIRYHNMIRGAAKIVIQWLYKHEFKPSLEFKKDEGGQFSEIFLVVSL